MSWLAALTFAAAGFGAATLAYTLSSNIERQPEYSPFVTDGMRAIGLLISLAGAVLGVVMLGYAVVAYVG